MIVLPSAKFRRRDVMLSALGSAAALLAVPMPVLAQVLAQAPGGAPAGAAPGGASAVIDVTDARNAPITVAITDLGGVPLGPNSPQIGTADLLRSGLFRAIDRASFIQSGPSDSGMPNFENWKPP